MMKGVSVPKMAPDRESGNLQRKDHLAAKRLQDVNGNWPHKARKIPKEVGAQFNTVGIQSER